MNSGNYCNIVGYILVSMDVGARRGHFYLCLSLE